MKDGSTNLTSFCVYRWDFDFRIFFVLYSALFWIEDTQHSAVGDPALSTPVLQLPYSHTLPKNLPAHSRLPKLFSDGQWIFFRLKIANFFQLKRF